MVLAGISLIITAAIDYDPMGWIVYSREVFGHGVLDTNTYPSWKPLPIILIGPFSFFFKGFADVYWWLWICRTSGILAVFGGAAIGYRLAGRWGAFAVGAVVLLSAWWFEDSMIGRDGPPSAALVVAAILAYMNGWRRVALICLVGVSLLRPEATPFLILYGLWEWRMGRLTLAEVVLAVVFIGVMWEIPTLVHAGKSPGSLATSGGVAGTPINAKIPFFAVLKGTVSEMRPAAALFCLVGMLSTLWGLTERGRNSAFATLWGRDNFERLLIAAAACWVLIIGIEAQFLHFSGNNRYQIPGLIVWCIVAGVTAVRAGGLVRLGRWGVPLMVAILIVPSLVRAYGVEKTGVQLVRQRQGQLDAINAELKQRDCPGYAWSDAANNAYLAVITGQSLPASIAPSDVPAKFVNGQYYFVYCAPAGWRPKGRA